MGGAILQQVFVVEYVVHHQMCEECHRRHAQDFWRAAVQVRQKVRNIESLYSMVYSVVHQNLLVFCVFLSSLSLSDLSQEDVSLSGATDTETQNAHTCSED